MGWWKEQENPEIILGDDSYRLTVEYLESISKSYQGDLSRKPTLAEFLKNVQDALLFNAHKFLSDCDEMDITKLTAKTIKRKKRQEYEIGDYFSIPLSNGSYGFGRIVAKDSIGTIITVLDQVSDTLKLPGSLSGIKPLFHVYVFPDAWEEWEWRILGGHEGYVVDETQIPCFKMGDDRLGWRIVCGSKERQASASEVANLEQAEIWPSQRVGWRIAAVKGIISAEDIKAMLKRGQELYEQGEYNEASKEFNRAYRHVMWMPAGSEVSKLNEQALHWIHLCLEKRGFSRNPARRTKE
jgi:Immunity protein 26